MYPWVKQGPSDALSGLIEPANQHLIMLSESQIVKDLEENSINFSSHS